MNRDELAGVVAQAKCRVFGWEDASNDAHRQALATLVRTVQDENATILCEPSLVRSTTRPPDIVLICPVSGISVIEVKGFGLDQIAGIDPGGQFVVRYSNGAISRNPFAQVRNAMFDVKDAAARFLGRDPSFRYWYFVAMPRISRAEWAAKWGEQAFRPPELLLGSDVEKLAAALLASGRKRLEGRSQGDAWPPEEFEAVYRAFGDTSVLFPAPAERKPRRVREATFGEMFDEAAEAYKTLSDEQQKLSAQYWERGPRLIRGVAGSGKTIVLANNLARRVQRMTAQPTLGLDDERTPRILAVCYNRTLVPFLKKKVETAYRQRTGSNLPEGIVEVVSLNTLMWELSQRGLCRYQKVFQKGVNDAARAEQYLRDLREVRMRDPRVFDLHAYDAIYCDEGQDFSENDFRILATLCRDQEDPRLFVFYDDAQNLYGHKRPNWQSLGLNVVGGRSFVMTECFRNTHEIVESAFNVLYGTYAEDKAKRPTKEFGDVATLVEKGLLEEVDERYVVKFARRRGMSPSVTFVDGEFAENELVLSRLRWMIEEQDVRPEDILVLSMKKERIERLARFVESAAVPSIPPVHLAFKEKDELLGQRKRLTFSTVASAKGYDAYCVLLVSANEFKLDVEGRASFYVGCTRAIEYLGVSGYAQQGLVKELQRSVGGADSSAPDGAHAEMSRSAE